MNSRVFKIFLLSIIFGVPVCWYLFLQLFGENQFELNVIRSIDTLCYSGGVLIYQASLPQDTEAENQQARLKGLLEDRGQKLVESPIDCIRDTARYDLYLIDDRSQLRGMYDWTISDIDRLAIELDLLTSTSQP